MHRRDLLRHGGTALLGAALPRSLWTTPPGTTSSPARLFFQPEEVPHIRANARTPLLRPVFDRWAAASPGEVRAACDKVVASGNLIYDLRDALQAMERMGVVHLVDPTAAREAALRYGIEAMVDLPKWDYFLDGDAVIGIMRSSMANSRLLFAREVLGAGLDPALDTALLDAVAEKGCLPCFRTLHGMDHPDEVQGWRFDAAHRSTYEIDMSRWPEILGANNLRAVPTMGLGLGALALGHRDGRAARWLDAAVHSARRFLGTFSPDGSYFEGLSYVDYALRTLLAFLDAHRRLRGTVAWIDAVNFAGVVDFILTMQAGRRADGSPDIVNFSDARKSVYPCVPAWIARQTESAVAQYAAENVSEPGYFLDFLWYTPGRPTAPPPDRLKNRRLDLGWVICRTGWSPDDAVLAFRSGGPANHEHADRNSLLFKAYGERLLMDHEGAAYDWRQPGWLLRLTGAHNAVLIGGQGHQYHNGEEGTNESQAEARLVRFVDEGDRVWWSSDATQAYRLVNPDVASVVRTVLFGKPDVVVLLDRVRLRERPARVDLRFFPDNRDAQAGLDVQEGAFVLRRPRARLHGYAAARSPLGIATHRLALPPDLGDFPFVEVTSPAARVHEVVTVLAARPDDEEAPPAPSVQPTDDGWRFVLGDVQARLVTTDTVPEVRWE